MKIIEIGVLRRVYESYTFIKYIHYIRFIIM